MTILNLTQHDASPEQIEAGVFNSPKFSAKIRELLTFDNLPEVHQMQERAEELARIAEVVADTRVMIGGAPFFMPTLARVLIENGLEPVFAFSRRESVEVAGENGEVRKTSVFRHLGFVEADYA